MILRNGKRIDGCTDTLPVGTVQPFLGLTPPLGYLVCNGQAVSKTAYPELYAICGDAFGESTATHFYLPDLRGKTIAGYNESDSSMNTLGKLLGQATHTHASAAHTHTVASHTHTINNSSAYTSGGPSNNTSGGPSTNTSGSTTLTAAQSGVGSHTHTIYDGSRADQISFAGFYAPSGTTMRYKPANGGLTDNIDACLKNTTTSANASAGHTHTLSSHTHSLQSHTHSIGAHGHSAVGTALTTDSTTPNETGATSNFQPTVVLNWIVKAVMLIPDYFIVENTLDSESSKNALSALQGKMLNDKIDGLKIPEIYNGLTSTRTDAALSAKQGKVLKELVDSKIGPTLIYKNTLVGSTADYQCEFNFQKGKIYDVYISGSEGYPSDPRILVNAVWDKWTLITYGMSINQWYNVVSNDYLSFRIDKTFAIHYTIQYHNDGKVSCIGEWVNQTGNLESYNRSVRGITEKAYDSFHTLYIAGTLPAGTVTSIYERA